MKIDNIYEKTFPACVDSMFDVVSEAIGKLERRLNSYEVAELFNIKVILNELLVNAIRHGCNCDVNKAVSLNCFIREDGRLVLRIRDEGNGYDYCDILEQEVCDIFTLDDNMKECGRGILIVKSLCEDLNFNSKGNEIEVILKID